MRCDAFFFQSHRLFSYLPVTYSTKSKKLLKSRHPYQQRSLPVKGHLDWQWRQIAISPSPGLLVLVESFAPHSDNNWITVGIKKLYSMRHFGGALLTATSLFISSVVGDADPIVIKGAKFFYQSNGTQL